MDLQDDDDVLLLCVNEGQQTRRSVLCAYGGCDQCDTSSTPLDIFAGKLQEMQRGVVCQMFEKA